MSFMEDAESHYADAIAGEMQSIEVPEWGRTIYFRPATIHDNEKVLQLNAENKQAEALVVAFIAHARDAEGKRLCRPADKTRLLRKVDQAVLVRVVNEMLQNEFSYEEVEKNS